MIEDVIGERRQKLKHGGKVLTNAKVYAANLKSS